MSDRGRIIATVNLVLQPFPPYTEDSIGPENGQCGGPNRQSLPAPFIVVLPAGVTGLDLKLRWPGRSEAGLSIELAAPDTPSTRVRRRSRTASPPKELSCAFIYWGGASGHLSL